MSNDRYFIRSLRHVPTGKLYFDVRRCTPNATTVSASIHVNWVRRLVANSNGKDKGVIPMVQFSAGTEPEEWVFSVFDGFTKEVAYQAKKRLIALTPIDHRLNTRP